MEKIKRYCTYLKCLCKLIIAFIYVQLYKKTIYVNDIWLIQEKHTEARDNGYCLFKYLRTKHPEINVYYSITKGSVDLYKVITLGNTVESGSITHYMYYLAAKYRIGSQQAAASPYPTDWVNRFKFLCRRDQKTIFLQHGITCNAVPDLYYEKSQFDLFVCCAEPELRFVHDVLQYPLDKAKLLGFCRYDYLDNHTLGNTILIMPTFRQWLVSKNVENDATSDECLSFENSDYFKNYYALLTNKSLLKCLRAHNCNAVFYLHYALQSYSKVFLHCNNDVIRIADRYHNDVQELMIQSSAMVSDYSSVMFDFAYMGKPVIMLQFDEEKYRNEHYASGYFDYTRDGFGPVYSNVDDTVQYLIQLIENGFVMNKEYVDRVNCFFTLRDKNNCERNYNAICNLK